MAAIPDALGTAGVTAADLTAIGITNQRETTVLWERDTLRPVHPAIVWQDRRTVATCDTLRNEGWEERVRDRTGLVIDPYFSGTKLAWLLEHVEGARKGAAAGRLAFGTVDSYLLARLTGGAHATDHTNASRTMLFDIRRLRWDDELCDRLGVPPELLPQVRASCGRFGVTESKAFFGVSVPISGIAGDQQASLFGQGCVAPGQTKNTYGTGAFVLMHTGDAPVRSQAGLLTTMACSTGSARDESHLVRSGPSYALEGSVFVSGAAIQWLRDGLGIIAEAAGAGPLAASVPDSGGVVFVPALTGLGAPWWDPHARGTILGITRGTTRPHLARATVEAIAYQTRDVLDVMRSESGLDVPELRVDGGASAMDLLLQVQADVLGVPVRRAAVLETTALGAAHLAGLAEGVWSSIDEIPAARVDGAVFTPRDVERAEDGYRTWRRAVQRSLAWAEADPTTA
jgi:glycerol kinase